MVGGSAGAASPSGYSDFTPVVLAGGGGTRLAPFNQGMPKALLPVGNHAMLSYSLRWLERSGFGRPIVITTKEYEQQIVEWVRREQVQALVHAVNDDTETAEALLAVEDKIPDSAIVVSCDTITDIPLENVLKLHRQRQATATLVLKHAPVQDDKAKQKERHQVEYVGLEEDNRVVFFASSAELGESVKLPKAFLTRRPNMTLTTSLMDGYIYVISKWGLRFLGAKKKLTCLKHEFLPVLVGEQFRRLGKDGTFSGVPPPACAKPVHTASPFPRILCPEDIGCGRKTAAIYDPVRVYAYIADNNGVLETDANSLAKVTAKQQPGEYVSRACYISTFTKTCSDLAKNTVPDKKTGEMSGVDVELLARELEENWQRPSKEGKFPEKVSVSTPSLIGVNYTPARGVVVKGSAIGNNVTIGADARVVQCIVMDGVTIEAGCNLQGCIVGAKALIPARCILKACNIGHGVDDIEEGSEMKNENIQP
eukprot:TRINITY_DN27183_c0_g1_i1.p1 TRINITY_DN27183_c0_g1~~TRINITY_DN27183_c0_g1_i1.p1  ORF type:complete len:481 (+),score=162.55 TRINITY_DN27183_c0_g1_i1:55-1497(+)